MIDNQIVLNFLKIEADIGMDGAILFAVDVSIISTGFYVSSSTKGHGIV
jgi:hypothetical protein